MHDLELATIVHAWAIWRYYLIKRIFFTEDRPQWTSTYITQSNLNARHKRWSELLSEYNFDITYIKGILKSG